MATREEVTEAYKRFCRDRNIRCARLFGSELGQQVLADLSSETVDLPVFRPGSIKPGDDVGPVDEALYAAWREGQNAFFRAIKEKIRLGGLNKP